MSAGSPNAVSRRGVLSVVGTPIGNLGDFSQRGVDTLNAADCVAAEDTRRARGLLTHFGVRGKPVVKLDANATEGELDAVLARLRAGEHVALVTDAGTPAVSDPGAALVRRAAADGILVVTIPGPSAVTAAVALSGLVEGPFLFLGFLPRKGDKRRRLMERIGVTEEPVILFESPLRTRQTLADLAALMPGREVCVTRELTKIHEEAIRGGLEAVAGAEREYRGEITIVLGAQPAPEEAPSDDDLDAIIARRLHEGATVKAIVAELSSLTRAPRRALYSRAVELAERLQGSDSDGEDT